MSKNHRVEFYFDSNCQIDPYGSFQTEITATWVILGDKNVPLNPPQTWGFQAKKIFSSDRFGPIEHLAWFSSPNLDVPRAEAWGVEEISATTLLLVDCFRDIDPDYEYTKKELNVCYDDDEGEDRVDLVEEQYTTAIENGEVIGE